MKSLNKLVTQLLGKPMTKQEEVFRNKLRKQVSLGELTIMEAHKIWDRKILNIYRPDWWYEK